MCNTQYIIHTTFAEVWELERFQTSKVTPACDRQKDTRWQQMPH